MHLQAVETVKPCVLRLIDILPRTCENLCQDMYMHVHAQYSCGHSPGISWAMLPDLYVYTASRKPNTCAVEVKSKEIISIEKYKIKRFSSLRGNSSVRYSVVILNRRQNVRDEQLKIKYRASCLSLVRLPCRCPPDYGKDTYLT